MKHAASLFLITVTFLFLYSCQSKQPETVAKKEPLCISDSMAAIIKIDTAAFSNVDDELKLSGQISFNENKVVKVFPFSSGQVMRVMVSLGDKVSKGQTLAIIRSADVAGNYSDLSTAGNDVSITKKRMESAESMFKSGLSSEREYSEAKEDYQKALNAANKVREQIAINGGGNTTENGTYTIKAPISGYVVEKKINQGSFIRADATDNLFTVGDVKQVWVWVNVYETDIAKVKEGYTAIVSTLAYPGRTFKGVVDKVSEVLDPTTKVMKIRVNLPNDSLLLKPEMFANIMITNKEGLKLIAIPSSALINDNGKNYVVIYHDTCKLELKEIQAMKTVKDIVYISSGLSVGDKVISKNEILLYNALRG
jgi:cobalt-zinc-cadmium efflux system membrane fusion protein